MAYKMAIAPPRSRRTRSSPTFTSTIAMLAILGLFAHRGAAQDVYAPFSGAIYIVGADGVQISAASPAYCPQYAALSCSGIGYPNWCCATDHTCQYLSSSSVVGCCPAGQTCSGGVSAQQITTVTVTVIQTQTQYVQGQGTTVYGGPAYVQPTTTAYVGAQGGGNVYAGYCSTLIADGPGLPTTRAGDCGTILVVSGAWEGAHGGRGWYGWGVPVAVLGNVLLGAWLAGVRRGVGALL